MAVITRTITNNLTTNLDLFVPGYNTIKPQVVISPSAMVDLFTVLTGDELEAIQNQLVSLIANGSITVNATVDTATFNPVGGGTATTIHADSNPNLTGNVQFVSGSNISLSQTGQAITVNATGELSSTLTNSHIFVGNGSNVATDVAMTGDITITNTGVTAIGSAKVTPAKISTTITDNFTFPNNVTVNGTTLNVSTGTGNATLNVGNAGASVSNIELKTGSGNQAIITYAAGGSDKWYVLLNVDGTYQVFDAVNSLVSLTSYPHGGVALSKLSTTAINALTGVEGMITADTTLHVEKIYNGTSWTTVNATVATVSLLNSSSTAGPTVVYTPAVAGLYSVQAYVVVHTGQAGDSFNLTIDYTDTVQAQAANFLQQPLDTTGTFNTAITTVYSAASQPISYDLSASSITSATYDLILVIIRLA